MKTVIVDEKGQEYTRLSRWIKIKTNYNPNNKNRLECYIHDGFGYSKYSDSYDPKNHDGKYLDYFTFQGRNYSIDQFLRLDYPIFYQNKEGKTCFLSGYDLENYYNPLLIEIDESGEYIRLYEEKRRGF